MGAVDSRMTHSVGVGRAATARVLPGLQKPPPGKDLAAGAASSPLLFVVLVLASFCSSLASALPRFLPPFSGSVRRRPWLRLPVHSHRGTKSVPLFLYTDRSPRA